MYALPSFICYKKLICIKNAEFWVWKISRLRPAHSYYYRRRASISTPFFNEHWCVSPSGWYMMSVTMTPDPEWMHIFYTSLNWPTLRGPHTCQWLPLALLSERHISPTRNHFHGHTRPRGHGNRFSDIKRVPWNLLLGPITVSKHQHIELCDSESRRYNHLLLGRSAPRLGGDCVLAEHKGLRRLLVGSWRRGHGEWQDPVIHFIWLGGDQSQSCLHKFQLRWCVEQYTLRTNVVLQLRVLA
jgi:hypothetical protein